jgi:hypothetical protein
MIGFNKSTHLLNETINDLTKVMIIKDNNFYSKRPFLKRSFENVSKLTFKLNYTK